MMIDDFTLARAVHVLALVHWIGGVAVVTTIVLPRARTLPDARAALAAFELFEGRFAAQARVSILLAGLSGFYMLENCRPGDGCSIRRFGGSRLWSWSGWCSR